MLTYYWEIQYWEPVLLTRFLCNQSVSDLASSCMTYWEQGPVSKSDKTSYRESSWSLEGTVSGMKMFISLWQKSGCFSETSLRLCKRWLSWSVYCSYFGRTIRRININMPSYQSRTPHYWIFIMEIIIYIEWESPHWREAQKTKNINIPTETDPNDIWTRTGDLSLEVHP